MKCWNCGNEVTPGHAFCQNCGAQQQQQQQQPYNGQQQPGYNQGYQQNQGYGNQGYQQNQSYNNQGYNNQSYQQPTGGGGGSGYRINAERNIITIILLTLVTCGLYSYYLVYTLAQDVNILCAGDGKETPSIVPFVLLSILTCGIYAWYWYYSLGNRLANNAPRYGLQFQETGTTIILWMILGTWLCGIGLFVGMYFIIKNVNALAAAYNQAYGL